MATALLAACALAPMRVNPIPRADYQQAQITGIPEARYWGDSVQRYTEQWLALPDDKLAAQYSGIMNTPHSYLAVSGGGADGAYGAGILTGWTENGTRPEFTIVTGISTGALIAPFAFLGPRYDSVLRHVYTELSTDDLVERRSLWDIIRNDSVASSGPLRRQIEKFVDDDVIAQLAVEHRRGRALLIGTTHLDAGRPVTWNITRIAASGAPNAKKLIHDVMLASASIPGIFPPVMIEVEANGKNYNEMHVDGGVTTQVFFYPGGLDWTTVLQRLHVPGRPQLYVIRNSQGAPRWQTVDRRLFPIMSRSLSSLIRTQGIGDMASLYFRSRRDGVDFHLAYIPDTFTEEPAEAFDREYMRKLFALGYERSRAGYPWTTGAE